MHIAPEDENFHFRLKCDSLDKFLERNLLYTNHFLLFTELLLNDIMEPSHFGQNRERNYKNVEVFMQQILQIFDFFKKF